MKKGFDSDKYLEAQLNAILSKINGFEKLYLEFGGKIYEDLHAQRVLPGYRPGLKIEILERIKDKCEIVFCISAKDIESSKMRGDFGMNYASSALKSINDLRKMGFDVSAIIINRFSGEKKAKKFMRYLDNLGIRNFAQKEIEGYPADVEKIVSKNGYGKNPYVKTTSPVVIVAGVGSGSGKMSFCLSQMYFDNLNGIKSRFAKFETFPVWDLPINHPVNLAYESATADIGDKIMLDPFYLNETRSQSVSYNRDIENFPILKKILKKIGCENYNSPTEMGVNKISEGIIDEKIILESAKQEIVRRYFRYKKEYRLGLIDKNPVDAVERIMQSIGINESERKTVLGARNHRKKLFEERGKNFSVSSIELDDKIVSGKNSELLTSESACILNALKHLSNIPKEIKLIPEEIISSVTSLKKSILGVKTAQMDLSEILIALSILSNSNDIAKECLDKIPFLAGKEMHTTHLSTKGDEKGLREMKINFTTDAKLSDEIYLID